MAPKKHYTPEQMSNAIDAVNNGEKIAKAAEIFRVPRITLYNKVSGKSPQVCSMGPNTVLSKHEEYLLEKWVILMSEKHVPVTKEELLDSVQKIIKDKHVETPFNDDRPGKKWYKLFLKRHPILAERTAQNLTTARDNVTEADIEKWFKEVDDYLEEKGLKSVLEEPERIFNTDESAFFLAPKPGKVLAKRGDKHVYSSSGDEKDNLTVLVTGNAAGQLAPPMIVYNYERVPRPVSEKIPQGYGVGRSPSGWMCGSTFYEYMTNVFNPWLVSKNIKKPVLFFLDGHKSHLTMHLSNFCLENGIEVIALNPNSTHILQPMDLAVFRPLKIAWKKAVTNWKTQNSGKNLKREDFAPLIKTALETISLDTIKNGFRAGGLCPFGPSYVDMTKLKSRNTVETQDLTLQRQFLKNLEKEIKSKLNVTKLQLFKEMFYKPRHEVDEILPREDISLYIIWASAKHTVGGAIHSDTRADMNTSEIADTDGASPESEMMSTETNKIQSETPNPNITYNEPGTSHDGDRTVSYPFGISEAVTVIPQPSYDITQLTIYKTPEKNNPYDVLQLPQSGDVSAEHNPHDALQLPQSGDVSAEHNPHDALQLPQSGDVSAEHNPHDALQLPQSGDVSATSKSKSPMKMGDYIIPSPFKRNLHWPEENIDSTGKKRRFKERLPFAVTGQKWREYHEKKEAEKKRLLDEKENRARERLEKKNMKEKLNKEKKRKRLRTKMLNTKKSDNQSTDETDTEVQYCESDNSNYEVGEDLSENDRGEVPAKFRYNKKAVAGPSNNTTGSKSEDMPLSRLTSSKKRIAKGDYVIVRYEGEYFPGVVVKVDKLSYEISTMVFSAGNTYKWPEKPDKIWYNKSSIIEIIDAPILTNKRGFYTIREMSKYHMFTV